MTDKNMIRVVYRTDRQLEYYHHDEVTKIPEWVLPDLDKSEIKLALANKLEISTASIELKEWEKI